MTTPNDKPAEVTTKAPEAPAKKPVSVLINRIEVFRFPSGSDRVTIYTGLPEATLPDHNQKLVLEFRAARGTGGEYCRKHFPGAVVEETEYK